MYVCMSVCLSVSLSAEIFCFSFVLLRFIIALFACLEVLLLFFKVVFHFI